MNPTNKDVHECRSQSERTACSASRKAHGPTLDLQAHPELSSRSFANGASTYWRRSPTPVCGQGEWPHEPGIRPGLEDVLKEVIALRRQVAKLGRQLEGEAHRSDARCEGGLIHELVHQRA